MEMEKLLVALIFWFCCLQSTFAQDILLVYGSNNVMRKDKPLQKGQYITQKDKFYLKKNAYLFAINDHGELYKINGDGKFSYRDVVAARQHYKNSFTQDFFKLVWAEMTHKPKDGTVIAGVFRGDVLMRYPCEHAKVSEAKVSLEWQPVGTDSTYYVFLRDKKSEKYVKLEVKGSQIAFYEGSGIFNAGHEYEWAVVRDAFPNLKNLMFYGFSVISRGDYDVLKSRLELLELELKDLQIGKEAILSASHTIYGRCVGQ